MIVEYFKEFMCLFREKLNPGENSYHFLISKFF